MYIGELFGAQESLRGHRRLSRVLDRCVVTSCARLVIGLVPDRPACPMSSNVAYPQGQARYHLKIACMSWTYRSSCNAEE
jgi:hypothetical protein